MKLAPSKATLVGFALGMCFSIAASMVATLTFLPGLINKYFPVIRLTMVGPAIESPQRMVSFYFLGHKVRDGIPRYYNFYVVNQLNQAIPVSAFKGNDDCSKEVEPMLVNHSSGQDWTLHYCFSLDGVIEPGQAYKVIGVTGHTAWPYVSLVERPTPSFVPQKAGQINPWGGLNHGP